MQQNAENRPPAPLPQALPLPVGQIPMIYNSRPKKVYTKYNSSCVRGMSITLIVLGIVCFIAQFADFFFYYSGVKFAGAGIWGGLFFILTGSFGVVSSDKRTTCTIVTFMVLCIIGSVLGIIPFGFGAGGLGAGIEGSGCYYIYHYCSYYGYGSVAVNGIMMIAAFTSFILMIVSSTYACKAVCADCCQENPGVINPGQVHYMAGPNGETQVIIMPVNQTVAPSNFAPSTVNPSGYIHPGPLAGSDPPAMVHPPPYQEQASLPEYETKKPMEEASHLYQPL